MLVGCWGILRSAIPQNISLTRTIALVHALAKLHNFCIAKQDEKHSKEPVDSPEMHELDEDYMLTQCAEGYITMIDDASGVSLPSGLMNCGHHSNDLPRALRRTRSSIVAEIEALGALSRTRELLRLQVTELQKTGPHVNAIIHK
jgi:hypothetical protein